MPQFSKDPEGWDQKIAISDAATVTWPLWPLLPQLRGWGGLAPPDPSPMEGFGLSTNRKVKSAISRLSKKDACNES